MDIVTHAVYILAKLAKLLFLIIEEKAYKMRQKRGYDVSKFDEPFDEFQYLRMATTLKTREIERLRGEIGESVVLRVENYPRISRRQARKVAEYWRLMRSINARK